MFQIVLPSIPYMERVQRNGRSAKDMPLETSNNGVVKAALHRMIHMIICFDVLCVATWKMVTV
jgi:hypothetical protein